MLIWCLRRRHSWAQVALNIGKNTNPGQGAFSVCPEAGGLPETSCCPRRWLLRSYRVAGNTGSKHWKPGDLQSTTRSSRPGWRSAGGTCTGVPAEARAGVLQSGQLPWGGTSAAPAACWVWARGHSNLGCCVDRSCRVSLERKDAAGGGGVMSRQRSVGLPA